MKDLKHKFLSDLKIKYPIIMAPMFLVSNEQMMLASIEEGVMGVFPSLNFREESKLSMIIDSLNNKIIDSDGNYGVNLIVQKSNIYLDKHLKICVDKKVPFYITSLGNPKKVIEAAHSYGAKVYCDVTNLKFAQKCYDLGCDGFIVVGQGAGGHSGPHPLHVLIPLLKQKFNDIPIIAAGGIVDGKGMLSVEVLGATGVSIGTRFIASFEASVNDDYKKGIVNAGIEDIVMTEKLSGTPCTIINTPTAKKMGYKLSFLEKLITKNKTLKKYYKMYIQFKGMNKMQKSASKSRGNYDELWCAGKSSALIDKIESTKDIIKSILKDYKKSKDDFFT